jgi:Flp pilus assembly pilin Flp
MRTLSDDGAAAAEYALMAGLIAVVIAAALGLPGQSLTGAFENFLLQMGWL